MFFYFCFSLVKEEVAFVGAAELRISAETEKMPNSIQERRKKREKLKNKTGLKKDAILKFVFFVIVFCFWFVRFVFCVFLFGFFF